MKPEQLKVGDLIRCENYLGTVTALNLAFNEVTIYWLNWTSHNGSKTIENGFTLSSSEIEVAYETLEKA
jgi:hypothetical protein